MNKSIKMDNRKKSPLDVEYTSGGNFMPRSYRHIRQYEDEIIELRSQGITKQKIVKSMASL